MELKIEHSTSFITKDSRSQSKHHFSLFSNKVWNYESQKKREREDDWIPGKVLEDQVDWIEDQLDWIEDQVDLIEEEWGLRKAHAAQRRVEDWRRMRKAK